MRHHPPTSRPDDDLERLRAKLQAAAPGCIVSTTRGGDPAGRDDREWLHVAYRADVPGAEQKVRDAIGNSPAVPVHLFPSNPPQPYHL
jgi:hypothetical protein